MAVLRIPVQNVSCDSCEKVITRVVSRFAGAKFVSISPDQRTLELECGQNDVGQIKTELSRYGYLDEGLGGQPFLQIARKIFAGYDGFRAENVFLTRLIMIFGVLFALVALFQFFVFSSIEGSEKLWPVLALVPLGVAVNIGSLWHTRMLGANFMCNTGMMIGMTIGMMAGFMIGAVLGATNGMFVGSVVGMLTGMVLGSWGGKSVGIMGVMEGMMAGLMAGLMGAMVSVMMVTDNLVPFLYILFASCTLIIVGLSYMIYKEAGPIMEEENVPSVFSLLFFGLVVTVFVVGLAVFGPKSAIAWGAV